MAQAQHTPTLASLEGAITVLFCLVDDAYTHLNPRGQSHESLKELSDSEVLTLALFQQLRGVESERSFLRETPSVSSSTSSRASWVSPLLVASPGEEAEDLPGALAPAGPARIGRRSRNPPRRLNALGGIASASGQAIGGFRGGGVGEVGIVRRLRCEAAPPVRDQPHTHLL
jgi:hypothetical protein